MFLNREVEAQLLLERLQVGPALVRLWGRRRLGKTSLLRHKLPDSAYLYVDESDSAVQLPRLCQEISAQTSLNVEDTDWSGFFRSLAPLDRVVVFDEFQRLFDTDPAAIAAFQDAWDNHLQPVGARIVLCGSSIGMMQRLVRGKRAPLQGRFTAQLQLKPLSFQHARLFRPRQPVEQALGWYGVFGGTPYYQEQAQGSNLMEAINDAFLVPTAPLLEEPENLLASELRRPATYSGVLQAVGAGHRTLGAISSTLRRKSTDLTPYVRTLIEDLGILRKDDPVLGPRQTARYAFADPFFRFYYTYIQPNLSSIHDGLVAPLRTRLETTLSTFLGPAWEEVVRQSLREQAGTTWRRLDLRVDRIGAWWTRQGDREIDVVAVSDNHVILGSCKWRSAPMDEGDLRALERAAADFPLGERSVTHLLASRAGFTSGLAAAAHERTDLVLIESHDLLERGGHAAGLPS